MPNPSSIELIAVSSLTIDPRVQRSLDEVRATRMSKNLDLSAIGTPVVSVREDGTMVTLDGQHRIAALKLAAGYHDLKIPCDVRRGLTLADEARLFRLLNESKQLSAVVDFVQGVRAGDPESLEINDIVTGYGWRVAQQRGKGVIAAIEGVRRVYRGTGSDAERGPYALNSSLWTLTGAFGHDPDAVRREMVMGFGAFFLDYEGYDVKKLLASLKRIGIDEFRHDAQRRQVRPLRLDEAVTQAVVAANNGRRRSKNIARRIDRRSDAA